MRPLVLKVIGPAAASAVVDPSDEDEGAVTSCFGAKVLIMVLHLMSAHPSAVKGTSIQKLCVSGRKKTIVGCGCDMLLCGD